MNKKFDTFSVPLGLLDYVNPILYTITIVTILKNTYPAMGKPYNVILLIGAVLSVVFGFVIPTGKVIVGLGLIKFVMPVSLVFCVNFGILLSGMMLLRFVSGIGVIPLVLLIAGVTAILALLYFKTKKFNTVAVLTGAFDYLLLYASLITLSIRKDIAAPVVLYAPAILLFLMLCSIGIKANLKNPKVHWVIEISNVLCQLLVAVATVVLF